MTNEPSEHDETCERGILYEVTMYNLRLEADILKYVHTQNNIFENKKK